MVGRISCLRHSSFLSPHSSFLSVSIPVGDARPQAGPGSARPTGMSETGMNEGPNRSDEVRSRVKDRRTGGTEDVRHRRSSGSFVSLSERLALTSSVPYAAYATRITSLHLSSRSDGGPKGPADGRSDRGTRGDTRGEVSEM